MTKTAPLGDVCEIVIGRTPARANPEYWGGSHPWLSIGDMGKSRLISETKEGVSDQGAALFRGRQAMPGTVLLSFKLSIGKVGIAAIPLYTNEAIAALPIRDEKKLLPEFLARYLEHVDLSPGTDRAAMGKTLNVPKLQAIPIPLPPLSEQRRIASILDQADDLRTKRRRALVLLEKLVSGRVTDITSRDDWPVESLGEVAFTQGGLTVNRKRNQLAEKVPYLRVANVSRGSVDLTEVKTLGVTTKEIERVALKHGDLLIVEGHGNEMEVGRAARWTGNGVMLHQNHLIRVRADGGVLDPTFAEAFVNGVEGRSYFWSVSKTTSGLNTINMSNVKGLPMRLPPIEVQRGFASQVGRIKVLQQEHRAHLTHLDELFASLQSRAFEGKL